MALCILKRWNSGQTEYFGSHYLHDVCHWHLRLFFECKHCLLHQIRNDWFEWNVVRSHSNTRRFANDEGFGHHDLFARQIYDSVWKPGSNLRFMQVILHQFNTEHSLPTHFCMDFRCKSGIVRIFKWDKPEMWMDLEILHKICNLWILRRHHIDGSDFGFYLLFDQKWIWRENCIPSVSVFVSVIFVTNFAFIKLILKWILTSLLIQIPVESTKTVRLCGWKVLRFTHWCHIFPCTCRRSIAFHFAVLASSSFSQDIWICFEQNRPIW